MVSIEDLAKMTEVFEKCIGQFNVIIPISHDPLFNVRLLLNGVNHVKVLETA